MDQVVQNGEGAQVPGGPGPLAAEANPDGGAAPQQGPPVAVPAGPPAADNPPAAIAEPLGDNRRGYEMPLAERLNPPVGGALDEIRAARPRPMKLPKYVEGLSMPDYMAAVRNVTLYNRWTEAEGAMQLRTSLEGKALKLALAYPTYGLAELEELFVTRFAEEKSVAWNAALDLKWSRGMSVEDLGDEVRRLCQLAYPGMNNLDREAQSVAVFTRALNQPTITFQIEQTKTETLHEAVKLAKRMDACRQRRVALEQGRDRKPAIRALAGEVSDEASSEGEADDDDVVATLTQELRQLRQEVTTLSARPPVVCHGCGGDHYIRGCPQGYTPRPQTNGGRSGGPSKRKPRQSKAPGSVESKAGNE